MELSHADKHRQFLFWRMIVFFLQETWFKKLIRSVKLCSVIKRFQARGLILISQLSYIAEMCHNLNEL
jgi:hypothetical protein